MASNWRQISGWLFLSIGTHAFPHMQNSSAIPILGGSGATLRPQQEVSHALGLVMKKLSPDCSMVVRLLGCLLWVLLGSCVFACFLLCLCVCLAAFQCKECQSRLSCRIPWRINMNSPPFVMPSNWRQISGWLFLSNETYVFPHMQTFLSDPNPRWEWRDLTPPTGSVACAGGGQEETLPRLINLGGVSS